MGEASLILGVSAEYIVERFPDDVREASSIQSPNFHQIAAALCYGPKAKGYGRICPRDGLPGCSVVDALPRGDAQKSTQFLSWCWNYALDDFTSSIAGWLPRSGGDKSAVFIWVCCFCNNQFRIMEE